MVVFDCNISFKYFCLVDFYFIYPDKIQMWAISSVCRYATVKTYRCIVGLVVLAGAIMWLP